MENVEKSKSTPKEVYLAAYDAQIDKATLYIDKLFS